MEAARASSSHQPLPPELDALVSYRPTVVMNAQGRIVLPADVRNALGLEAGERLVIRWDAEAGRVELIVPRIAREHTSRELAATREPGAPRVSDELIAERRAEAAHEASA